MSKLVNSGFGRPRRINEAQIFVTKDEATYRLSENYD